MITHLLQICCSFNIDCDNSVCDSCQCYTEIRPLSLCPPLSSYWNMLVHHDISTPPFKSTACSTELNVERNDDAAAVKSELILINIGHQSDWLWSLIFWVLQTITRLCVTQTHRREVAAAIVLVTHCINERLLNARDLWHRIGCDCSLAEREQCTTSLND